MVQFDVAFVLRIISEKNTKVLIDHGAVQIFVHLLAGATDYFFLQSQAIWALGNVARASVQSRDYVLRRGALSPLLAQLHANNEMSILTVAAWTLSTFCAGRPRPPFRQMKPALSALQQVLHINDEEFLFFACWALYYLSDGSKENIQIFFDAAGLVPRLVQLLGCSFPSVIDPAIRIFINLTNGDNQQTDIVIECGALPLLANLLTQDYDTTWNNIKRDACCTISKITAGTEEQIQSVINGNLIPSMVNLAQDAELDIQEKVVWAILNATSGGSHDQIKYLVEQGCIKPLCDLLVCPDMKIISVCLHGLENILKAGEAENNIGEVNSYSKLIEDAEGLEKIENLKSHQCYLIYKKALKIMETYWVVEGDEKTQ